MLRIEKNIKELLPELDARKRANIKSHLIKQVKNNNHNDSQLILFNLLIDEHEKNKKLEYSGHISKSMSSNILEEIKTAMEKRDTSKLSRFESYFEIHHKRIEDEEQELNELEELYEDYKQVIGERVIDWSNVRYDTTIYTTIYSKQSYLEFMEIGERIIKKSEGVLTMRLTQMKQEIVRNKSLNRFR